ncbi:MAG: hypothetical protein KGD60_11850, partial [Candidatus Thorarchaeota archaeon]|nr:hypothetical protein [Candidatus Thorarchaeota archaeon]
MSKFASAKEWCQMMRKNLLVIAVFVTLFGLSLVTPLADFESYSRRLLEQDLFTISGIGDNMEDYVDQVSNLHAPTDIGTHNVFTDLQVDDTNYDALTEANQGTAGNNVQDTVDSDATDIDSSPDVGTQGTFANAQDLADADFMTLQEADVGGAGINENLSIDAVTTPAWTTVGTTPYLDAQDQPTNYIHTIINGLWTGWFTFADTSGTSGTFSVNCSVYHVAETDSTFEWEIDWTGDNVADASGGPVTYRASWGWTSLGTITGLDTVTEINAAQIRFLYDKGIGGPDQQSIDASRLGVYQAGATDYELDFEYQWTGASSSETNEEVCINVQTASQGGENLKAWEWTGSDWAALGTCSFDGWNNFTATYLTSSTYYIKLNDSLQSDEATQSTWSIDSMILHVWTAPVSDYELDLEVGWTVADFDETNEELCIFPVTGGSWPAEDIKVDVWNGVWTNVIADLTPDQWNNVSISSYLTGTAFEMRFLGGTETGDTTQDTWEIDAVLIHTWTPSYTPVNDQAPTLDNPTNGNVMYAKNQEYQITVYVSDQNGYSDINYLELGLWNDAQDVEYCRFQYTEDTNSFSKTFDDAGTYVFLNLVSSTATRIGNDINATFYFTIDWDFPDATNLSARCYVVDAQTASDTDWYTSQVDWDVETRLDYSVVPSVNDGAGTTYRGDLDGSFSMTGTIIYYNSGNVYPPTDQVDVWVEASEYGTNVGPWNDTAISSGAFDVTCYADDAVGVSPDIYTVKTVEEGAGSGGSDLYYTTSFTDTYIADQLVIIISDPTDQRINIGENATGIIVSAIYDYDDSPFDGTLTLNDTTFDYGTAGRRGYTVSTASGGAHGVSLIGVNDATYCIWDSVTIIITDPPDQRQNLNANATGIVITGIYDYDGTAFDGTFLMNNTDYDGDGTAVRWGYTVSSISGGTHGITWISTNDDTYHIWDSVTITIVGPTDNRQDVNANATGILVSAVYDYDGAVFDGSFTMNNTDYNGDGTVGRWGYTVSSVSGDTYGITTIGTNDETFIIWDSLTIT